MAESERELLARVLGEYEQDLKAHDLWAAKVDRWYSSWRGILERSSPAAEWRSTLHPPYILQIVETLVAGVLDPNPRWKVRARQRMGGPEELRSIVEGAKALEILLSAQRDADGMVFKQRAHRLQGLIAGMSVWKTRWSLEERMVTRKQTFTETDENRDGFIDRAEFVARLVEIFFHGDRDKDGLLTFAEMELVVSFPEDFRSADTSGDGKVSMPEFLKARAGSFDEADADSDGMLSLEEVVVVFERKAKTP